MSRHRPLNQKVQEMVLFYTRKHLHFFFFETHRLNCHCLVITHHLRNTALENVQQLKCSASVHQTLCGAWMEHWMEHYPWKNTRPSWCLHLYLVFQVFSLLFCPFLQPFSIWELKNRCRVFLSLFLVDVLVSDDLVGHPVEDVEDEKSQRKSSSGDGVYPLGSVHKLLPHVHVFWDWRLRVRSRGGVLNSRAVFRRQTLIHVVPDKIKASLTQLLLLKAE